MMNLLMNNTNVKFAAIAAILFYVVVLLVFWIIAPPPTLTEDGGKNSTTIALYAFYVWLIVLVFCMLLKAAHKALNYDKSTSSTCTFTKDKTPVLNGDEKAGEVANEVASSA